MENLCLAQGRARGLLAIVYCCLFTCTHAYQNVFAGLLQLSCAAFNSSFGDLCELSSSRQCSERVSSESSVGARQKNPGCCRAWQELGAHSTVSAGMLACLLSPQAEE